jgi:hypothetical protein
MNLRIINLLLAVAWLLFGMVILLGPHLRTAGGVPAFPLRNVPPWMGYLAFFLAAYNVFRWWRAGLTLRRPEDVEANRRSVRREHREPQEPDPTFNFTEPPPQPEGGRPPERG